jgi:hypothetical protein
MKTTHQFVVMAAVVVVVVGPVVGLAYFFPGATPTGPVAAGQSWGEVNDYGVGLPNAIVLGPATSPAGYSVVYVQGDISALSWHRYVGGAGNDTGSCSAPTPDPGVCDVYVGVWTPTAWSTYASGGSATPLWCYSTSSSGCTNASTFSFTSSNLVPSGESEWEVVIWNVSPWGLYGFINATEYYGPVSAAP